MSDRSGTSEDDTETDLDLSNNEEDYYNPTKSIRLEFCIVKLKNDLNIFERRQPISTVDDSSLSEDIPGAVYFQYDEDKITYWAESEEKYPETHSRKYFFLPQKYMKEGNEAEVSELYTNLISRIKLEKSVTVVQVEPAGYKEAFENDPNLVSFDGKSYIIFSRLHPIIFMFSEQDQIDQFYAALAERNKDYFINDDPHYLLDFVEMIETAAKERAKGNSFRDQHIEAFSAAFLHLLKTSSYISGKAQETQRCAKDCIERWIDYNFYSHYENHSNRPGVFEELEANLFHLHLTRLVYQNYFDNRYSTGGKPAYWNPSNFGWVIFEVIEAKLRKKDLEWWRLKRLFMADIFQQPCFRRFLKDEQLRENFGNFILDDYPSIIKVKFTPEYSVYMENVPTMETLLRGNYEDLDWDKFLNKSTLGLYVEKLLDYPSEGISVMDTINITTAVLAMYPEEKGERRNCFSDISSELPLDKIYELYCQSKKEGKEVNPSAGLLWLGIAHSQAIGTLGELSEEQQTNCLEMLASALDYLPLQAIETFFSSIQGFTSRKTSKIEEKKKEITAYIARRKKEETAVLFLLHSEIWIEVVKVNANMARYKTRHITSSGIFIFMTLFEYTDKILEGTRYSGKKTLGYYVLTFTKYLINNTRVKNIFNKKNLLRHAVREHIKRCLSLKNYDTYEQLNDLLTLDWQTYYNKWVAEVQSHPHVVRIFGVVTDQQNMAMGLMMEYCEGGSLDKLFAKNDYTYDGKKTVHWMAQAASALIFFQKTQVMHLDIKPANMLLCKDHHYLKIADMGITLLAEIQDNIKLEPSISQKDKFLVTTSKHGTNGFMAPEVMGSDKEKMVCSYASDVFSLGRALWNIYYHKEHPWDEIVNRTVIMPVLLIPIFHAEDIPEDQTPQAVENITADMKKTLEQAAMKSHNDVKLECPERIAKWIIRMTRFDPDARPTAVILHEEFKKQYKEYKRIEKEEALKETRATLQIIPSTKITFLHPIEVNRSVSIMLENTSNAEILQWSASSSNEKIAVVPAKGDIPPSEVVKVTLTYGEKGEENMGNFIVNYRIKMDTDEAEKELWASKHLKIVCNL